MFSIFSASDYHHEFTATTFSSLAASLSALSPLSLVLLWLFVVGQLTEQPVLAATTITVSAKSSLQAAVDEAQPGDTIIVEAGASFGSITLPVKPGASYITIQSSRAGELPTNTRILPSDAPKLASILTPGFNEPAVKTNSGAHHFQFVGIEFVPSSGSAVTGDMIKLGSGGENTLASLPHDFIIDRCYIHSFDATTPLKRGVALNGNEITVKNSYISGVKGIQQDTQALCGWNGAGPFHILNNYLEAAGEIVMFGGSDPAITNLVPSDIEIRSNTFFKPLTWKADDPSYAGTQWAIKNLLELKNAQRVVIDSNTFENNWAESQAGFAILMKSVNQGGGAPWSVVQQVIFSNNTVTNSANGINLLGTDQGATTRANNLIFTDNTFKAIGGTFLQVSNIETLTVDHNTHYQQGSVIYFSGPKTHNFTYTNNLTINSGYGVKGDSVAPGTPTLNAYCDGYTFTGNAMVGVDYPLPSGNVYPASVALAPEGVGRRTTVPVSMATAKSTPSPTPITTPAPTPVNQKPVADIGGLYSGVAGQVVQFNGSKSFDPDGGIVDYQWDFGDGSGGSGATPTHTYATAGTFNVTLTVKDNAVATSSIGTTATINPPPSAPSAPTSLALSDATGGWNATFLKWQDNSSNETSFSVERGTSQSQMTPLANVPADTTVYTDASASNVQTYYYRVCAANKMGFSCSNIAMRKGITAIRKDRKNVSTVLVDTKPVVTIGSSGGKLQSQSKEEKTNVRVVPVERNQRGALNARGRER